MITGLSIIKIRGACFSWSSLKYCVRCSEMQFRNDPIEPRSPGLNAPLNCVLISVRQSAMYKRLFFKSAFNFERYRKNCPKKKSLFCCDRASPTITCASSQHELDFQCKSNATMAATMVVRSSISKKQKKCLFLSSGLKFGLPITLVSVRTRSMVGSQ